MAKGGGRGGAGGAAMAHFFALRSKMDDVAREYFRMTQDASDNLGRENAAVISVQSFYRATRVRKTWHATQNGTMLIQRVMRGWLGRAKARAVRAKLNRRLHSLFFEHCASVIQKYYRGFRSRRWLHNFHGRKQYLEKIEQRGEYTKEWLQRYEAEEQQRCKQEEETKTRDEFDNLAGDLHHLVSTKAMPGVYNPPYNDVLPQAFGKPIEGHLRDSCRIVLPRSLRRPRHRAMLDDSSCPPCSRSRGLECTGQPGRTSAGPPQELSLRAPHASRSASVGRMQKIQGPFRSLEQVEVSNAKAVGMYRTVQASAPYHAVLQQQRMDRRLEKLTRLTPDQGFTAPGCPGEAPPPSSVHVGVPHVDKPAPLRSDYTTLPKIRDKPPFFTAMPHDRHFAEYGDNMLVPSGHV